MCMKYINANTTLYETVTVQNNIPLAYERSFDTILASPSDRGYTVPKFTIVTDLSILGTNNTAEQIDHVLYSKGILEVILRITKCDADPSKQVGTDVDHFKLDFEKIIPDKACYPFYNYTRITRIQELDVPELGAYVVKTLIKTDSSENYSIQSMRRLIVSDTLSTQSDT